MALDVFGCCTFCNTTAGAINYVIPNDFPTHKHSLEDLQKPQTKSKKDYPKLYEACVKHLDQEEKKMSYDRNTSEDNKRRSLEGYIYNHGDTVETRLSEKFGLRDLPAPKTVQEYVNRLKAGEYVIEKDRYSDSPKLRWRLPTTVEDLDGFNTAWDKFYAAREKVLLKVAVADLQEALKAVEDFRDTDVAVYYS